MQSVTEMKDLDDFVYTAELKCSDFTAEKLTTKILIEAYLPGKIISQQEELAMLQSFEAKKDRLRIPRRPKWSSVMTAEELDRQEKDSFLAWRREFAQMIDVEKIQFTPFEKNLEIWRQLWRVVEKW